MKSFRARKNIIQWQATKVGWPVALWWAAQDLWREVRHIFQRNKWTSQY